MKKLFLSGLLLSCSLISFGQENVGDKKLELEQLRIRKLNTVSDLENQINNIPFAAVRNYARYRIASWLWNDGKDDTGRAEDISRDTIDDHYKNKGEIPPQYSVRALIFVLLDRNAKDLAKKLREKYKPSASDEALELDVLFRQKDGEKLAVDAAVRQLSRPNAGSPMFLALLIRLDQQGSTEINRLLGAIMAALEVGRISSTTNSVEIFSGYFIKPSVPVDLRKRFIGLVLNRSRNAAALSVLDQEAYYRMMQQKILPDISANFPELLAEAGTIHAFLSAKVGRSVREANALSEKLRNSPDLLAATVAEAESSNDDTTKYVLYKNAARLALKEKKFVYAADLMEKAADIDTTGKATQKEKDFRKGIHDQLYREVVTAALEANEADATYHSIKKMDSPLNKAEGFRNISKYFIEKNDFESGRSAHDEAIKFLNRAETSAESIGILIRMLPTAQKIDQVRVSELTGMIAKKINAIPTLNVEDKPDTKNYLDYVTTAMTINANLHPALKELVKADKNAAADLTGRIEKKEIRIIADYVLLTESIDSLPKPKKALGGALPLD